MRIQTALRKSAGHFIDSLAWLSMHAIARRQEGRVRPYFPEALRRPSFNREFLFPAPTALEPAHLVSTAWEKRKTHWQRTFAFPTALPSAHAENNTVFVRALAPAKELRRPAVLLLHGLMHVSMIASRPLINLAIKNGAAAYAPALPYHHRRAPAGSISGDLFHTADLEMTLHAVQQAVSDTRRLVKYLKQEGAPCVGILGFSLGAWIGALAACSEPDLDFAFLGMPPNHLNHIVWHSALGTRLRRSFAAQGWHEALTASFYDQLDPITYSPLLSPEKLQFYAAEFDSLIALDHVHALRQAWARPGLRLYPHGHLSIMISRQLHRDFHEDLRRQLAAVRAFSWA